MEHEQKATDKPAESLDYSGAKKPWLPWILFLAIIYLVTWIRELEGKVEKATNDKALIYAEVNGERRQNKDDALELAQDKDKLMELSNYYELLKDSLDYYRRRYGNANAGAAK